jgi:hypothetical protein
MEDGFVFTTRMFIGVGSRSSLDKCLQRMVMERRIVRLARGIFAKEKDPMLSTREVAEVKLNSFEKKMYEHPSVTAQLMGYAEREEQLVFATNGTGSSSFMYGEKRIQLRAVSAKRRHLRDNFASRILHSLWHLGKENITRDMLAEIHPFFGPRTQRDAAPIWKRVPHWLVDKFRYRPEKLYEITYAVADPRAAWYNPVFLGPAPWVDEDSVQGA